MVDSKTLDIDKNKENAVPVSQPVSLDTPVFAPEKTVEIAPAAEMPSKQGQDPVPANMPEPKAQEPQSKSADEKPKKDPKKLARVFHGLFNFLGMHWVANSSLSLWITYNLLPTKGPQKLLSGMTNVMKPMAEAWQGIKNSFGFTGKITEEMRELPEYRNMASEAEMLKHLQEHNAMHSARSFVETLCMCVAGSIILGPVKWWEDNKKPIVDTTHKIMHPGWKEPPPGEIYEPPEHKETWTNLIRARFLALFPIFALDNRIQAFNNARFAAGKGNLDTLEWGFGSAAYDKMSSKWRERFINFFSSKGANIEGVQGMLQHRLLDFVGPKEGLTSQEVGEFKNVVTELGAVRKQIMADPTLEAVPWWNLSKRSEVIKTLENESHDYQRISNVIKGNEKFASTAQRAVFAEQGRMFTKEVSLTLIYTGFLFILGKTGLVPWVMDKIGFKKKEEKEIEQALKTDVGLDVFDETAQSKEGASPSKASQVQVPQKVSPSSRIQPREPMKTPEATYSQRVAVSEQQPHVPTV